MPSLGINHVPRGRVCRTHPPLNSSLRHGHANWPGVRALGLRLEPPGTSTHNTRRWSCRSKRAHPYYRRCSPAASRSTMSENSVSVSMMSSMAPVISNSTNPCIADQNSNAA